MFGFLKNKIKVLKDKFKKKIESDVPDKKVRIVKKEKVKEDKLSFKEKIVKKFTEKILSEIDFNDFFSDFEMTLLQANVAVEVIDSLKNNLKTELVGKSLKKGCVESELNDALSKALNNILLEGDVNLVLKKVRESIKPVSFMFVGTNGSGKTTSIAKFANFLLKNKVSVVFAACDTFRAASIEQLEVHGERLGVKVVKHSYGSDAASVAFDALRHAESKGVKAVLIDTAGRSHSNANLMKELEKVARVVKPDFTVFVGDALTGNEVVLQCRDFSKAAKFDYAILTKTDVDEKGGAIISVSHATGVPILFLGVGQEYSDLKPFKKNEIIKQLV